MADAVMVAGVQQSGSALFGLVLVLLLAGAACSYGVPLLGRAHRQGETAKNVAMAGGLTAAGIGSLIVVVASLGLLMSCRDPARTPECASTATLLPLPSPAPGLPPLSLTVHIDGLAALFLAVVGFCAAAIAIYSIGWLRGDPLRHNVCGSFNLFLAATLLTVMVSNVFWLFLSLELITLCSVDLVRYKGRRSGTTSASRTAVQTYLVIGQIGLMLLVAGMLPAVVRHQTFDFVELADKGGSPLPELSFVMILLGLCARAGVTPFHFWVPTVHPQLPTNMHAMMSAVMLKIPVYLMIRLFFTGMIGPVAWWWGATLVALAGVTALVTVFYALVSKDLKTALAYHSVENIGIILAGVGLALLFRDDRFSDAPAVQGAAAIALLASLYHVVNHALFKSLLFLGTGSIERQTGTVVMGRLGGLLRRLPWTGVSFLVGAAAIAGLPGLNGFISEWLTIQSLFGGQASYRAQETLALVSLAALVLVLVTLAMAIAVTALAFVKISGEALLGEPRERSQSGHETWSIRIVLAVLALCCLALGLQPWLLVPALAAAMAPLGVNLSVLHASPAALTISLPAEGIGVAGYQATLPMLPLLLLGALVMLLAILLRLTGWRRRPVWVGGGEYDARTMRYPGGAASALLWEQLATGPSPRPEVPLPASIQLSPRRGIVEVASQLYNRVLRHSSTVSQRIGDRLQDGDIRGYLLYVFVAVVAVLGVLAVAR